MCPLMTEIISDSSQAQMSQALSDDGPLSIGRNNLRRFYNLVYHKNVTRSPKMHQNVEGLLA